MRPNARPGLRLLVPFACLLLFALPPARPAAAVTITVDTTTDEPNTDRDCSLREAVCGVRRRSARGDPRDRPRHLLAALDTPAALATCVGRQLACRADQLAAGATPRLRELLDRGAPTP